MNISPSSLAASPSFVEALHADGPAPDRADQMGLYGRFVGRWEMDAIYYPEDGSIERSRGEIHFGWVLEGRAIQDVWIVPPRGTLLTERPAWWFYGTTLRVYDPGIDAWHILWIDPVKQNYRRQIGRALGDEILQEGTDDVGLPVRWRFTEITPNSFHWIAERVAEREAGGERSWRLLVEFFARRVTT